MGYKTKVDIVVQSTRLEENLLIDIKWALYVESSSNRKGKKVRMILKGPKDKVLEYSVKFDFKATNNQVEYEALIVGLFLAKKVKITLI